MKNIIFYGYGSSSNHGCEAIIRSTKKILDNNCENVRYILISNDKDSDIKWKINDILDEVISSPNASIGSRIVSFLSRIMHFPSNAINSSIAKRTVKIITSKNPNIAISVGGDNFCYSKEYNSLFYKINNLLHKKNIKTAFWGCSISKDFIDNNMIDDLKNYNIITVRESITFNNLHEFGIVDNVKLYPDPAFSLDCKKNDIKLLNDTIGINVSPLIMKYSKNNNIILENYLNLIEYILHSTTYNIVLIPHVFINDNNDLDIINLLYSKVNCDFKQEKIRIIQEFNCEELKWVISQCRFFIGARTHSTIAAYSSCIPTLVIGYSVKAKGIAKDIFNSIENFVIPVQNLKSNEVIKNNFIWLENNEEQIRKTLKLKMNEYRKQNLISGKEIKKLLGDE